MKPKSRYDRVIVEDSYRSAAIAQFVADLIDNDARPGIVFCRLKRHAELLTEAIVELTGWKVPTVTSDMPRKKREDLADRMRERDPSIPVAVCCMVWSTGIDIPCLEWVLWAGAGQAPIWLKQGGGRGVRLEEAKAHYTIYDWQDVGPDTEPYQEQSKQREQHYKDGGFQVNRMAVQIDEDGDEGDAVLLAELYAKGALSAVKKPKEEPEPEESAEEYDGATFHFLGSDIPRPPAWFYILLFCFSVFSVICQLVKGS